MHQAMTEVLVETGGNLRGGEAPDMQFEPSGEAPLEIMLVRKSVSRYGVDSRAAQHAAGKCVAE